MEICEQCSEWISARLDGELTGREEQELEAHLTRCPRCRALAERMEAVHAAFPLLEEYQVPEGFAAGVMDRVRAQKAPTVKVVPLFRRPGFRAAASLAACAVLCLGLYQAGSFQSRNSAGAAGAAMADSSLAAAEPGEAPRAGEGSGQTAAPNIALYSGVQRSDERSADGSPETGTTKQEAAAVLTLSELPEGAGLDTQWLTDEAGRPCHLITGEQLDTLMKMAQEQGITADLTGTPEPEKMCMLVLATE